MFMHRQIVLSHFPKYGDAAGGGGRAAPCGPGERQPEAFTSNAASRQVMPVRPLSKYSSLIPWTRVPDREVPDIATAERRRPPPTGRTHASARGNCSRDRHVERAKGKCLSRYADLPDDARPKNRERAGCARACCEVGHERQAHGRRLNFERFRGSSN